MIESVNLKNFMSQGTGSDVIEKEDNESEKSCIFGDNTFQEVPDDSALAKSIAEGLNGVKKAVIKREIKKAFESVGEGVKSIFSGKDDNEKSGFSTGKIIGEKAGEMAGGKKIKGGTGNEAKAGILGAMAGAITGKEVKEASGEKETKGIKETIKGMKETGNELKETSGVNEAAGNIAKGLLKGIAAGKTYIQTAPYGVEIKQNSLGRSYATKPQTKEFEKHDDYMKKIMEMYDRKHGTKPLSFPASTITKEDLKAYKKREKFKKRMEKAYRKKDPEYAKQAKFYEKMQKEADKLNKDLPPIIY